MSRPHGDDNYYESDMTAPGWKWLAFPIWWTIVAYAWVKDIFRRKSD